MPAKSASEAFDRLLATELRTVDRDGLAAAMQLARVVRGRLDVIDVACARRARELAAIDGADSAEGMLIDNGRRSGREAKATGDREKICNEVPEMEAALGNGDVSTDHLDALARAAEHLDDAERADLFAMGAMLTAEATQSHVESFARTCRDMAAFVHHQHDPADDSGELDRQRAASKISRWVDRITGMHNTTISLDPLRDAKLWQLLDAEIARQKQVNGNSNTPFQLLQVEALFAALNAKHAGTSETDQHGSASNRTPDTSTTRPHPPATGRSGPASDAPNGDQARQGDHGHDDVVSDDHGGGASHHADPPCACGVNGAGGGNGSGGVATEPGNLESGDNEAANPRASDDDEGGSEEINAAESASTRDHTEVSDGSEVSAESGSREDAGTSRADETEPNDGRSSGEIRHDDGSPPGSAGTSGPPLEQPSADEDSRTDREGSLRESHATGPPRGQPSVPEVYVHIDIATLIGGLHASSISELSNGVPLPVSTVRRLCCDANIIPVVFNGKGELLDVGREYRTATRAQRRALRALYRTCAHPHCTVAFDNCRIHHVEWWERGGVTDLNNLVPLCERHHHLVHEGGWNITMSSDRQATWHQPTGARKVSRPDRRTPQIQPDLFSDLAHAHQRPTGSAETMLC